MSALGSVQTLSLLCCTAVEDVSSLGGVHTLCLEKCSNITDISALGTVVNLNVRGCNLVTDYAAVRSVENLMCCGDAQHGLYWELRWDDFFCYNSNCVLFRVISDRMVPSDLWYDGTMAQW